MPPNLLVVGGNGFLGSAVCRTAVKKGWNVTSISSSGKPFTTAKGHSPAWTSEASLQARFHSTRSLLFFHFVDAQVTWRAASAFEPSSFLDVLSSSTAVVHTLGTLFENTAYKQSLRGGGLSGLLEAVSGSRGNPLSQDRKDSGYWRINHDSALSVLEAYLSASRASSSSYEPSPSSSERTFVYISAEDIFSPIVPRGYIESKRQAEEDIADACSEYADSEPEAPAVRSFSLRPGLMYHPHLRPLTTPLATLLSASAQAHRFLSSTSPSSPFPFPFPTPAGLLQTLAAQLDSGSSSSSNTSEMLRSGANALITPPMHVDHVALAACLAIESPSFSAADTQSEGSEVEEWEKDAARNQILGVREMRELIGWSWSETAGRREAAFD